jgi:hypothetical protein
MADWQRNRSEKKHFFKKPTKTEDFFQSRNRSRSRPKTDIWAKKRSRSRPTAKTQSRWALRQPWFIRDSCITHSNLCAWSFVSDAFDAYQRINQRKTQTTSCSRSNIFLQNAKKKSVCVLSRRFWVVGKRRDWPWRDLILFYVTMNRWRGCMQGQSRGGLI